MAALDSLMSFPVPSGGKLMELYCSQQCHMPLHSYLLRCRKGRSTINAVPLAEHLSEINPKPEA
jgi:hypothetical protein